MEIDRRFFDKATSIDLLKQMIPGDVVQLLPCALNPMFSYCMMTILEMRPWGAIGYVQGLGQDSSPGREAHYRAEWCEMAFVGLAHMAIVKEPHEGWKTLEVPG